VPSEPHAIHGLLRAWTNAGVHWMLLRDLPRATRRWIEIDLLVDDRDLGTAETILHRSGYRRQVSPGRGSHRFYLRYAAAGDVWMKLDVVTRIEFGRHQQIVTSAARDVLGRARNGFPAPADACALLLLHYLLDGSPGRLRHRSRLVEMCRGRALSALEPAWNLSPPLVERLEYAVTTDAWSEVERLRGLVVRELGGSTRRSMARHVVNRSVRWAARRLPIPGAGGGSVALLGPDGAGKSTLASSLRQTLPFRVEIRYAGAYGSDLGQARHVFGASLPARMMTLWLRFLSGSIYAARGGLVLYDRHPAEARIGAPSRRARTRLRRWLLAHAFPGPDRYLILDAPPEMLLARKAEHERAVIERNRHGYLDLAASLPRTLVLDASQPPDLVRRQASAEVWQVVRRRLASPG
jgi:hypothetical protein